MKPRMRRQVSCPGMNHVMVARPVVTGAVCVAVVRMMMMMMMMMVMMMTVMGVLMMMMVVANGGRGAGRAQR
ncbi:MAG: hypothetical protein H0X27_00210 [Caulobacteraceae bacterium]|nr:hypothetical protein [Caulobacteraceae bacterium]